VSSKSPISGQLILLAMQIACQWEGHESNYHTYLVHSSGYPKRVFTVLIIYHCIVLPLAIIYKLSANLVVTFKINSIVSSVLNYRNKKIFVRQGWIIILTSVCFVLHGHYYNHEWL
jgi:hypothetical protein